MRCILWIKKEESPSTELQLQFWGGGVTDKDGGWGKALPKAHSSAALLFLSNYNYFTSYGIYSFNILTMEKDAQVFG
mgnify:CR=1 FL=1